MSGIIIEFSTLSKLCPLFILEITENSSMVTVVLFYFMKLPSDGIMSLVT